MRLPRELSEVEAFFRDAMVSGNVCGSKYSHNGETYTLTDEDYNVWIWLTELRNACTCRDENGMAQDCKLHGVLLRELPKEDNA